MCKPYVFELDKNDQDDGQFIAVVQRCLATVVRDADADAVRVVHIDNWFDKKWLNFSGKRSGAIGLHLPEVTIPPFHPNRVLDERVLKRDETGVFTPTSDLAPIHTRRTSESNTRLKMDAILPNITAWYSGESTISKRAALMMYHMIDNESTGWYVGFEQSIEWKAVEFSGIPYRLFKAMLSKA